MNEALSTTAIIPAATSSSKVVTLVGICTFLLIGCSSKKEDISKLATVYAASLQVRQTSPDSATAARRFDSVLKAHSYTKEEFEQGLRDAKENPEMLRELFDSTSARLKAK